VIKVWCDGSIQEGNPGGVACYGFTIDRGFGEKMEGWGIACEGEKATVNVAEYNAVMRAIDMLITLDLLDDEVEVFSDSQLIVYQLSGKYAVRGPNLQILHGHAKELLQRFKKPVKFTWIPREQNIRADDLSRRAYEEEAKSASERRA
jgi:ribonuclease HI